METEYRVTALEHGTLYCGSDLARATEVYEVQDNLGRLATIEQRSSITGGWFPVQRNYVPRRCPRATGMPRAGSETMNCYQVDWSDETRMLIDANSEEEARNFAEETRAAGFERGKDLRITEITCIDKE
jgi:hypothetical protein